MKNLIKATGKCLMVVVGFVAVVCGVVFYPKAVLVVIAVALFVGAVVITKSGLDGGPGWY